AHLVSLPDQEHAEGVLVLQAFADHVEVARFEDPERQGPSGIEDGPEREQWNFHRRMPGEGDRCPKYRRREAVRPAAARQRRRPPSAGNGLAARPERRRELLARAAESAVAHEDHVIAGPGGFG